MADSSDLGVSHFFFNISISLLCFCYSGCVVYATYNSWFNNGTAPGWDYFRDKYEARKHLLVVKGFVTECSRNPKQSEKESPTCCIYKIFWPLFKEKEWRENKKQVHSAQYFDDIVKNWKLGGRSGAAFPGEKSCGKKCQRIGRTLLCAH